MVADLAPGSASSGILALNGLGDIVLFFVDNYEIPGLPGLWRSDGTTSGTTRISEAFASEYLLRDGGFARDDGAIYFAASLNSALNLWKSDGTDGGTFPLSAFGHSDSSVGIRGIVPMGRRIFFDFIEPWTAVETWVSHGAPSDAVVHFRKSPTVSGSDASRFVCSSGRSYFSARTDAAGTEVWTEAGPASEPAMVADIYPGPEGSYPWLAGVVRDRLIFSAIPGSYSTRLFALESPGGQLVELAAGCDTYGDCAIPPITRVEGGLLVSGVTPAAGREPIFTDGSTSGTRSVDLLEGPEGSYPRAAAPFSGKLALLANGEDTLAIWSLESSAEEFDLLIEGTSPGGPIWPSSLSSVGDSLTFIAWGAGQWRALWAYDKKTGEAAPVHDLNDDADDFGLQQSVRFADRIYFVDFDDELGQVLFSWTPGESSAEYLGPLGFEYSHYLSPLTVTAKRIFTLGNDSAAGVEIWHTDGVREPHLLKDIYPGAASSRARWLTAAGDRLLFVAQDDRHGAELWVSDGSARGTRLLADLYPGPGGSNPRDLKFCEGRLYFSAFTPELGYEPYVLEIQGSPIFACDFEDGWLVDWSGGTIGD
ncbi:MAG: ELWxxDGT repeat protein [Candidatus Eisenbacteria bacterium]